MKMIQVSSLLKIRRMTAVIQLTEVKPQPSTSILPIYCLTPRALAGYSSQRNVNIFIQKKLFHKGGMFTCISVHILAINYTLYGF